jgi:hypothetical protein
VTLYLPPPRPDRRRLVKAGLELTLAGSFFCLTAAFGYQVWLAIEAWIVGAFAANNWMRYWREYDEWVRWTRSRVVDDRAD